MSIDSEEHPQKMRIAFSFGEIGDGVAYQTFSFLVFTFYFSVVKLPIQWISTGFIIWSVWNSINDPLIGYLSDKTKNKKYGRRIPWMIGSTIPLGIMMILLFTPPLNSSSVGLKFGYFLVALFLFDTIYTMFNLNYNSLFSEIFISVKDRSEVGRIRGICVIISLIFAFVLPMFIIEDVTNQYDYPYTPMQFVLVGVVACLIIYISYAIVLKRGVVQPKQFLKDHETAPPFFQSLKMTLKNKAFLTFVIAALATWIANGILPTIIPYFATYILGIADVNSILIGVLLFVGFLVAAFSMPLWTKIRQKKGARYTGMLVLSLWAITLLVFMFTWDFISGIIVWMFVGLGLGGSIYFYDQCIAEIIDDDEIQCGSRRAGGYYGVISFFIRLAGVINFVIIGLVFTGAEWAEYTPNPGVNVQLGLQFLIGIYPAIILGLGIIGLYFYPIKGKRLMENQKKLKELHDRKLKNT